MIIVLNDADFSAKNIGQIELPIVIDPEVEAVLAHYGRSFTISQKAQFQLFYKGLKRDGIYDKLTNLYLPILSNTVNEAMFNIKADRMDASNVSNSNYKVENGALMLTSNSIDAIDNPLSFPFSFKAKNHTLAVWVKNDVVGSANKSVRLLGAEGSYTSDDLYSAVTSSGSGALINYMLGQGGDIRSIIVGVEASVAGVGKGLTAFSANGEVVNFYSSGRKLTEENTMPADNNLDRNVLPLLSYAKTQVTPNVQLSAMYAGVGLTIDEMETLSILTETLISKLES